MTEPERTSDDRDDRRTLRINARRDRALGEVVRWLLVFLVVGAVAGVAHQAWIAGREPAAVAPKPGPQTLTLAKWEPVFEIEHPPNPPAGSAIRWADAVTTIRVKVSDTRHQVYSCTGPIEVDGPIADYKFQVEGGNPWKP